MPQGAADAIKSYAQQKADSGGAGVTAETLTRFAQLIHADPPTLHQRRRVPHQPRARHPRIGRPHRHRRSPLHRLVLYARAVRQTRHGRRHLAYERQRHDPLERYEEAIQPGTKLVALSLVSMVNGVEHDVAQISEIAHARGACKWRTAERASASASPAS